jgi:geranylgeranyl diphosphate synthase type II
MTIEDIFLKVTQDKEPQLLYQPVQYILMQSGKRLRPRLVILATELFHGDKEKVLPVAAAFEMLHNFTLIHDDIMDNAPLRRGKETVYKKWNSNIAILSGDALATMALQQLLTVDMDHVRRTEIISLFAQTSLEVCEGQQYDLNFETSDYVSIDDYFGMIRLKTAVMLAGCLKAGAIFAGADAKSQNSLYEFGISLGLAFQLKDDLLDIYADHEIFGKIKGIDIQDNKKTYLYLRALQDASQEDRIALQQLFTLPNITFEEKLEKTVAIYEKLSIKEKTEDVIFGLVEKGVDILQKIEVHSEKKNELILHAKQLMNRDK